MKKALITLSLFLATYKTGLFAQITTVNFAYTGAIQNFVVPACVTQLTVSVAGAQGGGPGGLGATVTGVLNVTPGAVLQVKVGGMGAFPGTGWPGGGNGPAGAGAGNQGGAGGGYSSIAVAPYAMANSLIVAGGGGGVGGGNTNAAGGFGGCANGGAGGWAFGQPGGGGSQFSGGFGGPPWIGSGTAGGAGSQGQGGAGGPDPCYNIGPGGGGGGGWYGGGGGGSDCFPGGSLGGGGGGGGSSLTPAGGGCVAGNKAGNGAVTISYLPGTPVININSATVCAGQTATLTATVTPVGGTFNWSPGGLTGNPIQVAPATTTQYTLNYNAGGCSGTKTVNVVVNPSNIVIAVAPTSVACNGGNNGQAQALVGGGTPGYTYTWSPFGGNAATAPNLPAGIYTVSVKDANGCPMTQTVNILQPTTVTVTAAQTASVGCNGGATGAANSTPVGGMGGYTYTWSPSGGNAQSATGLTAGVYTVSIKDQNGCPSSATVNIAGPTAVSVTASQTQSVSCFGGNNGIATAVPAGGMGGYTYTWSPFGGNAAIANNLTVGIYTVTMKDVNGCQKTATVAITGPTQVSVTASQTQSVLCNGGNTGAAIANPSGGNGGYTYTWSPSGGNGQNAINLTAGTYTVNIQDATGCPKSATVTIVQPSATTLTASQVTSVSCNGGSNGVASAVSSGGVGGYVYTWAPSGGNNALATGLTAGLYTVTMADANGCTKTATALIIQPLAMGAVVNTSSANCTTPGSATVLTNGGNPGYTYTWSPSGGNNAVAPGLAMGSYTVLIKDATNCTLTATGIVTGPPSFPVAAMATTSVTCINLANGSATVTANSGSAPYGYTWTPAPASAAGNNPVASNLPVGSYTVLVKDNNNCTVTAVANILQPTSVTLTASQTTSVLCNGGTNGVATSIASGGVGGYTYTWMPSGGNGAVANGLAAGIYTVTAADANGCPKTATAQIIQPTSVSVTAAQTTSVLCNGGSNGVATAIAAGGVGGYVYNWSPFGGNSAIASNLNAGVYTINIIDANGCPATATAQIVEPTALGIAITTQSANCITPGSATVLVNGGMPSYSYTWSPGPGGGQGTSIATGLSGGTYTCFVTDNNNCPISVTGFIATPPAVAISGMATTSVLCNGGTTGGATVTANAGAAPYSFVWTPAAAGNSSVAANLPMGSYTVVVTDMNSCTVSAVANILQPPAVSLTASQITSVSCFGGSNGIASANASGGVGGFTYTWMPSGGNASQTGGIPAGPYTVNIMDANGCPASANTAINEPPVVTIAVTSTSVLCNGGNSGTAQAILNGGVGNYVYTWTPNGGNNANAVSLTAGNYTCTSTDANGCLVTATTNIAQPAALSIALTQTNITCNGYTNGAANALIGGGTGTYNYNWIPSGGNSATASNLAAGGYSLIVTDGNNCLIGGNVQITQPSSVQITAAANASICYGQNYNIFAAAQGGTPPYNYMWTGGTFTGPGPHGVTPTTGTNYGVTAIDALGCLTSTLTTVVDVSPRLLAEGITTVVCHGEKTYVFANITSPGKGGPYTYNWNSGHTSSYAQVLGNYATTPNMYQVTISDGCSTPATANVTVNVNPTPKGSFQADIRQGCVPLKIKLTAASNGTNDAYLWNVGVGPSGSGQSYEVTYNTAGTYSVALQITSSQGCRVDSVAVNYITVHDYPYANFHADKYDVDLLDPVVQFVNTSQNAATYLWDFGTGTAPTHTTTTANPSFEYSSPGTYTVFLEATNAFGCKDYTTLNIKVNPEFYIWVPNAFSPNDDGINDVFQPKGFGIIEGRYSLQIFDRWGELIWSTTDFPTGWDGHVKKGNLDNSVKADVYIYKIVTTDMKGKIHEKTGHVSLLR